MAHRLWAIGHSSLFLFHNSQNQSWIRIVATSQGLSIKDQIKGNLSSFWHEIWSLASDLRRGSNSFWTLFSNHINPLNIQSKLPVKYYNNLFIYQQKKKTLHTSHLWKLPVSHLLPQHSSSKLKRRLLLISLNLKLYL